MTPDEKAFFLSEGYLHRRGAITGDTLTLLQQEFDRVWEAEGNRQVSQTKLLKYPAFLDLIEHPAILDTHRALFGNQIQLLQYDLLRQGPNNETFPLRAWHRDFVFPGDNPLSVNSILYLDDMGEAQGPTRVVPRSHLGANHKPPLGGNQPLPDEVAVYAKAGDVCFINSAIWHTGGRNTGDGLRRGVYLYYGYWWLKRYEANFPHPWQALKNASEQRLQLLGIKMPDSDLHMYNPDAGR